MDAGVFTKKIGPLPVWGWMGAGTGLLLFIGSAGKGKANQKQTAATPQPQMQPPDNTQDPTNSLGQFAGGVFGTGGLGTDAGNRPWSAHTHQWTGGNQGGGGQ